MLSNELVDRLFGRLQVRYGSAWAKKWEGIDELLLKADWAAELAGFSDRAWAIKYALENLPATAYPPTSAEFRDLCRQGLARAEQSALLPALHAPKVRPEKIAAALAKLAAITGRGPTGPRAWIGQLRAAKAAGVVLSAAQRDALAWAERHDADAGPEQIGEFAPIPNHLLPPGMRARVAQEAA